MHRRIEHSLTLPLENQIMHSCVYFILNYFLEDISSTATLQILSINKVYVCMYVCMHCARNLQIVKLSAK